VEDRFNTAEQMRESVFFDGPESGSRYSRFWLLLILSAVIASAGVVADSTATVIGAMIVAPLMTPILGTMLATVLGDRGNLIRSLLLVVGGAATAVAIGYLVGILVVSDVLAETNPQVAGRVSPGLIDLLAALGTGVVGSIALVRRDISDALPGVAIAISLVPPLTVAGLALESGSLIQFLGALLLFLTNVVAIIGTGIVVMSLYGVSRLTRGLEPGENRWRNLRRPTALLAAMFLLIGLPLTFSSLGVAARAIVEQSVHTVADEWAGGFGWRVDSVTSQGAEVSLRLEGPSPVPNTAGLNAKLEAAGLDTSKVTVTLVPVYTVRLGGTP
jgi:uncharacterized hydrophobic protein (TIGR00271 family)